MYIYTQETKHYYFQQNNVLAHLVTTIQQKTALVLMPQILGR